MADPSQQHSLPDYLSIIRRRGLIVVVVAVVCTAAGLAASLLQEPTYEARASLAVRDPNEALTIVGASAVTSQTPLQLASRHVPQVTSVPVVRRVKASLRSEGSTQSLVQAIDVSVNPNSALIEINAESGDARQAAAIANAFARQDAAVATAVTRREFELRARQLQRRLRARGGSRRAPDSALEQDQLSRLRTLSSVAAPVVVNATARVPTSPSSPRSVRNTLAALALGLLLGIAAAYLREVLDRRLREASDVDGLVSQPVVGRVPPGALGHAGTGASNGLGPMDEPSEESFRILRQNVRYLSTEDPLRKVLVTSAVAQEGKSTVAAGLAVANAAAGKSTLLVECDLHRPVLAHRFGLSEGPGLTDLLTGNAELEDVLKPVEAHGELVCVTCGTPPPRPAELLGSERFQRFLAAVGERYESVIIDSAPLLAVSDALQIIPQASGVLLCIRLGQTTRDQLRSTQEALSRLPVPPAGVVLTDVQVDAGRYYGYYGYSRAASSS